MLKRHLTTWRGRRLGLTAWAAIATGWLLFSGALSPLPPASEAEARPRYAPARLVEFLQQHLQP